MNSSHSQPARPSPSRFAQPQQIARANYIEVLQKKSGIPYSDMLKELKELQSRIESEHDEALRYFSGLYTNKGLLPRLLSPAEISKRLSRLVQVEAQ